MSKVSVCAIVPTYNRADMLRECLNSLVTQTKALSQIIVVNDGSTDHTKAVVCEYPQVEFIDVTNGGKARALNIALSRCSCDAVWICDDDDIAALDACEKMALALEADAQASFVYGRYRSFTGTFERGSDMPLARAPANPEKNLLLNVIERLFVCQFSMLVRKGVYDQVGAFREDLLRSQDYDMIIKICHGFKGVYVPDVLFYQRNHAGTRGPSRDRFQVEESQRRWLHYDKLIFQDLFPRLALADFKPAFVEQEEGSLAARATYLQRACIFGRKALWDIFLADMDSAVAIDADRPPSAGEKEIATKILLEINSFEDFVERRDVVNALVSTLRKSRFGRALAGSIIQPIAWHIMRTLKQGRPLKAMGYLGVALAVAGVLRTSRIFLSRIRRAIGANGLLVGNQTRA